MKKKKKKKKNPKYIMLTYLSNLETPQTLLLYRVELGFTEYTLFFEATNGDVHIMSVLTVLSCKPLFSTDSYPETAS